MKNTAKQLKTKQIYIKKQQQLKYLKQKLNRNPIIKL